MRIVVLSGALFACAGADDGTAPTGDDDTGSGGCGAVTEHTITVRAKVVDGAEQPVVGATVALEERNWEPGTLGQGVTDAAGEVTLADLSITGVEDCWGTALDYVLVATEGERSAEEGINPSLFNAVSLGETEVDRRLRPLVLE